MKLPHKVIIAGQEWTVKTTKDAGASFDAGPLIMKIGTKYPKDIPMLFLHEVLEALMYMRGYRYPVADNQGEFLFNFFHKDFDNLMYDLALALKEVLK